MPNVHVTGFELLPVRATERTVWLMVRLTTDQGLAGLGEASDAFGFANTTKQDALRVEFELRKFFALIHGKSPLDIEAYRQKAEPSAVAGGLISATAYSAIEQALFKTGTAIFRFPPAGNRDTLENQAVAPCPDDVNAPAPSTRMTHYHSIFITFGERNAIMTNSHSFFDVPLAQSVARRLEPHNLAWYEEPVAPGRTAETLEIRRSIRQPLAGGEMLFGIKGFAPLCRSQAVHVIMPDVKHCGGLLEMTRIAALAHADGISVAPHNPSGPVATAASVQVCAGMANFRILELQWGEVGWRSELIVPEERFERGSIHVPERPGFGMRLNDKLAKSHPV